MFSEQGTAMRVLWVGKEPDGGNAGDEIYDRKIISAARNKGASIVVVHPKKASRGARALARLSGVPHYRDLYAGPDNRRVLREISGDFDIAVCSWEPFDLLATSLKCPVIPILHNVTSCALPSMFPRNPVWGALAVQAASWERKAYSLDAAFPVIAALSRCDERCLQGLRPKESVLYVPPGMPQPVELDADARFKAELLISGTFDWYPKRRDILSFGREYAALSQRLPVLADPLPSNLSLASSVRPLPKSFSDGIRLGLIPDRFVAGHKLKATAYIANNAIVLSYSDISKEFEGIEDHEFFIRTITNASDIGALCDQIGSLTPAHLCRRMTEFKARCARRFSWSGSAGVLLDALQLVLSPRGTEVDS
ncbi:hypothetical protein ACVWWK_008057 [Bradyrhizobium sp. LB9.1b]